MADEKKHVTRIISDSSCVLPRNLYCTNADDEIVSVERGDRGTVFDADGRKVEKCIDANLTTGRCVVYRTDRNGKIIVNSRGDAMKVIVEYAAVPLRFKPRHGDC